MASQWYFQVMGQVMGPVDARILKDRVRAGDIGRETLVRKGEVGEWILAERITELFPPLAPPRFDEDVTEPPRPADSAPSLAAAVAKPAAPAASLAAESPPDVLPDAAEGEKGKKGKKLKVKASKPKVARASPFLYALTDRTFSRFVTLQLIPTLQTIAIVVACLTPIGVFATGVLLNPVSAAISALISAVFAAINVVVLRIVFECVIVLFRISDRLGDVKEMGVPAPETPAEPSVS